MDVLAPSDGNDIQVTEVMPVEVDSSPSSSDPTEICKVDTSNVENTETLEAKLEDDSLTKESVEESTLAPTEASTPSSSATVEVDNDEKKEDDIVVEEEAIENAVVDETLDRTTSNPLNDVENIPSEEEGSPLEIAPTDEITLANESRPEDIPCTTDVEEAPSQDQTECDSEESEPIEEETVAVEIVTKEESNNSIPATQASTTALQAEGSMTCEPQKNPKDECPGTADHDPTSIDVSSSSALITPRSTGLSFAEAFSDEKNKVSKPNPSPPAVTLQSPSNVSMLSNSPSSNSVNGPSVVLQLPNHLSVTSPISVSESVSSEVDHSVSSHSALSASRNKKAAGLISKYQEKVAHEPLPGDSVTLKKPSWHRRSYSPSESPSSERMIKEKIATTVELEKLPDMNSVREKFEKTSSHSSKNFEFGESFRQKKRYEQLSEKERKEEAKVAMRGFNEKLLTGGRTASGEIDTSNLPKSFTFDVSSSTTIMPNDGICRVDYQAADYHAQVFVVHPVRGMLLLEDKVTSKSKSSRKKKSVPGGMVKEEEFLSAAKISGSPQVQLQIAAREAAARHLYEATGLDIRQQAERLKPAVLSSSPSMNAVRGFNYLRNENDNKLYYFLQVDESDFEDLKAFEKKDGEATLPLTRASEDSGDDPVVSNRRLTRPSPDSGDDPVELRLSHDFVGFEFVHDPMDASKVLKNNGNDAATALSMIMNAASKEIKSKGSKGKKGPDAKATEHPINRKTDEDGEVEPDKNGRIRTVGEKDPESKKKDTENAATIGNSSPSGGKPSPESLTTNGKTENTFYDDEAKLNIKPSTDTADEAVAVSCCCSFW